MRRTYDRKEVRFIAHALDTAQYVSPEWVPHIGQHDSEEFALPAAQLDRGMGSDEVQRFDCLLDAFTVLGTH